MVKNLPAMQEIQVQSLGWEDPLEEGMATHYSILAWKISWTEEPGVHILYILYIFVCVCVCVYIYIYIYIYIYNVTLYSSS